MHPLETFAGLVIWAGESAAYNLQFIPAEKLSWKPAPTANSAFEIVQHVCGALRSMQPVFAGGEWNWPEVPMPTTLAEAQEMLTSTTQEYAAALRQVERPALTRMVVVSPAQVEVPLVRAASMPVVDMIHHHGQIVYIQALLGDAEFHFQVRGD
jgi:hypothetical protein